MQKLADTYGSFGDQNEQVTLLRHILELKPQSKNVRDYLAHLEPPKPKPDEVYAVASERFSREALPRLRTDTISERSST